MRYHLVEDAVDCFAYAMLSDPYVRALECWNDSGSDDEHEGRRECALEVEREEIFYTSR